MALSNYPLLIPGINPSSTVSSLIVTAPYDGKEIATIACADEAIIQHALEGAYTLYKNRDQWLSLPKRIEIFEKAIALLSEKKEALALEAAREGGKPFIDSLVEAERAIDSFKICVETMRTSQGHVIPMNYNVSSSHKIAFTQKEPIGVVVAVSAFNHPLNLIAHQVGSALAAGCPVIVKPATDTPLSCWRIVDILHQSGLPPVWAQVLVIKDNTLATQLVTDSRVGFFSFIGSAAVGWRLRSQLAPGVRCSLEHGGVAPVIVAKDANLDEVVPSLIKGGFYHAGQVCVSVQRVFAEETIADELTDRLANKASQLKVGDPTLLTTEVGPLIRPSETHRIDRWVKEAVQQGGKLMCGGEKISDSCYQCTVLYKVPFDAIISQNEVFGPVVCVYPYKTLDEAILRANQLPYAFQAAIFTNALDSALHAYSRLDASAVMVNEHTAFRVDGMPFAGLRHSGLGVGGIPYSIAEMQIDKMMVLKSNQIL